MITTTWPGRSVVRAAWNLTVGPSLDPFSVEEAKAHMRITDTDDDVGVLRHIQSATRQCEEYLGRGLLTQTWTYAQDVFTHEMWLPRAAPLQNDAAATPSTAPIVTYYDSDGNLQTLADTVYLVDTMSEPGRIVLAPDQSWPATHAGRPLAVQVTYVVGWTDAEQIPADIRDAIGLRIGTRNEYRESVLAGFGSIASELPDGVTVLLAPHRVYWREPQSCDWWR